MKFILRRYYYSELKDEPGFYHIIFPNGKMYVGNSTHIKTRIMQHFKGLQKANLWDKKWYSQAAQGLQFFANENKISFSEAFFRYTKIMVQYTWTTDDARDLEVEALTEILERNKRNDYYNTQYYKRVDGDNFKRTDHYKSRECKKSIQEFQDYL